MKKVLRGFFLLVMAVLCFGGGYSDIKAQGQKEKVKAPTFSIRQLDGELFDMQMNKGFPQVIIFWTTRCPYCVIALRRIKDVYNVSTKTRFVAISLGESEDVVKRFVEKNTIRFPVAVDTSGMTGSLYNVYGIPTIVVIDEEGNLASYGYTVTKDIENLLSK